MIKVIRFVDYKISNELRMKIFAKYSKGLVLDVGAAQLPNKFLDESEKVDEVWLLDIEKPKIKLPKKYKRIILFDIDNLEERLPFSDNTFDTIILGEILEHLYNPFRVLKECKRILKPRGVLLISTPTPKYYLELIYMLLFSKPMGFPEHKILFTRNQMCHILCKIGFTIDKTIGYNFWIPLIKWGFVQTNYRLPELFTWQQIYICRKL